MSNPTRKTSSLWSRALLALVVLGVLPTAGADDEFSPAQAIKARQSAYFLMGQQLAKINATIKGDVPFDEAALEMNAHLLVLLNKTVPSYYPAGSDKGSTKAKADIWKSMPDFTRLAHNSQAEAEKLGTAIATGDMAQIKAAYGSTSRSCRACHDSYKEK